MDGKIQLEEKMSSEKEFDEWFKAKDFEAWLHYRKIVDEKNKEIEQLNKEIDELEDFLCPAFLRDEYGNISCRTNQGKEIERLKKYNERFFQIIKHIDTSTVTGDVYCGDKSIFANGQYSVLDFIGLALNNKI